MKRRYIINPIINYLEKRFNQKVKEKRRRKKAKEDEKIKGKWKKEGFWYSFIARFYWWYWRRWGRNLN